MPENVPLVLERGHPVDFSEYHWVIVDLIALLRRRPKVPSRPWAGMERSSSLERRSVEVGQVPAAHPHPPHLIQQPAYGLGRVLNLLASGG